MRPKPPRVVDLPRLFGSVVHQHIERMEQLSSNPEQRFYYKDRRSAVNAAYYWWNRALEENRDRLILVTDQGLSEYQRLLGICINQYWNTSVSRPRPIHVEWKLTQRWDVGVALTGVIDQVRPLSIEQIRRFRPALVQDSQLVEGYDPVWLVDLKTNRGSFTPYQPEGQVADTEKWVRQQFELHNYLQPTIYTWLYERTTGKKPIGFIWWHLRSGQYYPTFRVDEHYARLARVVDHVVGNLEVQSFPEHVGTHCRYCDFINPCQGGPFLVAWPGNEPGGQQLIRQPNPVIVREPRQLRLRLQVERQPGRPPDGPDEHQTGEKVWYIGERPWDDP